MTRNIELENQLWQDPDWACPNCGFVNMAIRSRCRNNVCNKHVDELFPGEGLLVGCFEIGEDGGGRKNVKAVAQEHGFNPVSEKQSDDTFYRETL